MGITSIKRDWGITPSMVRISTTNTLAEVEVSGYITSQSDNIEQINKGTFEWNPSDSVLVYASDGSSIYSISSDFSSLIPDVPSTGEFLRVENNLDDVANRLTSYQNMGFGKGSLEVFTDSDFSGGESQLTNPPPNVIVFVCSNPDNVVLMPEVDEKNSLQKAQFVEMINESASVDIIIQDFDGNAITTLSPLEAKKITLVDTSTPTGVWVARKEVIEINGEDGIVTLDGNNIDNNYITPPSFFTPVDDTLNGSFIGIDNALGSLFSQDLQITYATGANAHILLSASRPMVVETASESVSFNDSTTSTNLLFDIESTTRGAIVTPPMTLAQRNAISSPVAATMIFATDDSPPRPYIRSSGMWNALSYTQEITLQNAYNTGTGSIVITGNSDPLLISSNSVDDPKINIVSKNANDLGISQTEWGYGFSGLNSTPTTVSYGRIVVDATSNTASSQTSNMIFYAYESGSAVAFMSRIGSTSTTVLDNNVNISSLSVSSLVATDSSKNLTSTTSGLSPTFTGLTLGGLSVSSLVATDGSKALTSSTSSLSPTFIGLTLSSLTASTFLISNGSKSITSLGSATNGQLPIGSTGSSPVLSTLTQGSGISISNGAGSITIAAATSVATTYTADSGTATPSSNNINVLGTSAQGITSSATGSTVTFTVQDSTTSVKGVTTLATGALAIAGSSTTTSVTPDALRQKLGTQTSHGLLVGAGTSSAITALSAATNGQIPIGSTGADPVLAAPTNGNNITWTAGAGTLKADLTGTTNHTVQVGNSSGSLTSLAAATNGQLIIGSTGADPAVASMTNGNNITWTGGAGTLKADVTGTTNHAVQIGNSSGSLTSVSVGATGTVLLGATGADPTWGSTLNGPFTYTISTANQNLIINISQTDSVNSGANAILQLTTNGASGGSPFVYTTNGVNSWVYGLANANTTPSADPWVLANGSTIASFQTIVVATTGEVLMPRQPLFSVYLDTSVSNVTGDNTTYTIIFDVEIADVGSNFNLGTSIFTAPVTGTYEFHAGIVMSDLTSSFTNSVLKIETSNRIYYLNNYSPGKTFTNNNNVGIGGSILADMDAGDTAKLTITVDGSTKTIDVQGLNSGQVRTYWQGRLSC